MQFRSSRWFRAREGGKGLTRHCSGLASLAAEFHIVRPQLSEHCLRSSTNVLRGSAHGILWVRCLLEFLGLLQRFVAEGAYPPTHPGFTEGSWQALLHFRNASPCRAASLPSRTQRVSAKLAFLAPVSCRSASLSGRARRSRAREPRLPSWPPPRHRSRRCGLTRRCSGLASLSAELHFVRRQPRNVDPLVERRGAITGRDSDRVHLQNHTALDLQLASSNFWL